MLTLAKQLTILQQVYIRSCHEHSFCCQRPFLYFLALYHLCTTLEKD